MADEAEQLIKLFITILNYFDHNYSDWSIEIRCFVVRVAGPQWLGGLEQLRHCAVVSGLKRGPLSGQPPGSGWGSTWLKFDRSKCEEKNP